MLEVLADPLGLALHATQMARSGPGQVQLGSGRRARGHTLLDVGVGHLVGIEFGAIVTSPWGILAYLSAKAKVRCVSWPALAKGGQADREEFNA